MSILHGHRGSAIITCAIFHVMFVTINCSSNNKQYSKTNWLSLKIGEANLLDKMKVFAFHLKQVLQLSHKYLKVLFSNRNAI